MNERVVLFFYLMLGICMEFPWLAVKFWLMDDYGVSIASVGAILSTVSLPWCLKPLWGYISDNYPIAGRRRKPYIILCNVGISALWVLLASSPHSETGVTGILLAVSTLTCFSDVLYDAAMVGISQTEHVTKSGSYQSLCWTFRSLGSFVAAVAAGFLLETVKPTQIFGIESGLPIVVMLGACFMYEKAESGEENQVRTAQRANWRKVLESMRDPKLWKPAVFVCAFALTPGSGNAWFYYLVEEHGFTPKVMGGLTCVRHGSMLAGTLIYRRWLREVPFRRFFVCLVLLSSLLSLTPLLLFYKVNSAFGIPDLFFVAGDDVFLAAIGQIAMMPCLILVAKLCPEGVEASLYATFVALINFSGIASDYLSSSLTWYIGVTYTDFEKLPVLIVVCAATSLLPLLCIKHLPPGTVMELERKENRKRPAKLDEAYLNELVGLTSEESA